MSDVAFRQSKDGLRVLVVDDSKPVQRLVTAVLDAEPDVSVVAVAADGRQALELIEQCAPDRLILDLEMPGMGGVEVYDHLQARYPKLPVVVFTGSDLPMAGELAKAIAAGEVAVVPKPAGVSGVDEAFSRLRSTLVPAVKSERRPPARPSATLERRRSTRMDCLLIGASTGGPRALEQVFGGLLELLPVPAFVVQHIGGDFAPQLVERLDVVYPGPVSEAVDGVAPQPGHIYVAAGRRHLEVNATTAGVTMRLHDGPPENSCRPAVDVLFRSAAKVYGGNQLAIVLTGMGEDGVAGCQALYSKGARIVVQDEASSVVWGMPGAVVGAGLANEIVPLHDLGPRTSRWLKRPSQSQ